MHIYLYITAVITTISLSLHSVPQNQDSVNTDTVCRLYEVGRQRLAEEEEEDEEDQVHLQVSRSRSRSLSLALDHLSEFGRILLQQN